MNKIHPRGPNQIFVCIVHECLYILLFLICWLLDIAIIQQKVVETTHGRQSISSALIVIQLAENEGQLPRNWKLRFELAERMFYIDPCP